MWAAKSSIVQLFRTASRAPLAVRAQQTGKIHRVGVLFAGSGEGSVPDEAFRSGLRERGYIEAQNIIVEFRSAAGKFDDLPGLASELVALNPDVIFAPGDTLSETSHGAVSLGGCLLA